MHCHNLLKTLFFNQKKIIYLLNFFLSCVHYMKIFPVPILGRNQRLDMLPVFGNGMKKTGLSG